MRARRLLRQSVRVTSTAHRRLVFADRRGQNERDTMNEHDESELDDPGLKSAVRRAVGRETAPASLRAKVTSLLCAQAAGTTDATTATHNDNDANSANGESASRSSAPLSSRGSRRLVIDRSFWRTAAAAACVLLALGWMTYQIRQHVFPASPYASAVGAAVTAIPASFVLEIVRTHDNCAKLDDHHKIPGDDPEALRDKLSQSGVPASAPSLGGGWKFKGAGICQVGETEGAHLLFVRGDKFVSVFSLPPPEGCGHGGESYKDMFEKHPVAGFRRGEALYCIVGSSATGEFTEAELDPVLQKVQASVASGCMTHDTIVAVASPPRPR